MKRTYFEGRPPWYDTTGSLKNPYVIGIAGGSASGKTSVCHEIVESLGVPWVSLISMDSFYKGLTPEQRQNASEYNFDHPDAFDFEALVNTVKTLKEGKSVNIPIYDFKTHSRSSQTETKYGADVIIVEGIFVLYSKQLIDLMDMKLFVDEEDDIRLARRLKRDIAERGRDIKSVLEQYEKFVKPAFDDYILPTKKNADIIIPRGQSNKVAINLIAQHIKQQLLQRGWVPPNLRTVPKLTQLPPTVHVLKSNKQIESIHTIIRNKEISRDDFVFYSDRLSRLVIEHALQFLPSEDIPVETPTGAIYKGKRIYNKICALPIMRAGDSMVPALCSVVRNVKVGKILIQSDKNKTPKLFFFELPKNLDDHYVLVLDPLLGTGSTVTMAIRLLLDHNIPQEKIIFINLISSPQGVDMVTYTFPKVNIVTSAIDTTLSELGYILPGIGNFGDRYLGTDEEELDQEANKV